MNKELIDEEKMWTRAKQKAPPATRFQFPVPCTPTKNSGKTQTNYCTIKLYALIIIEILKWQAKIPSQNYILIKVSKIIVFALAAISNDRARANNRTNVNIWLQFTLLWTNARKMEFSNEYRTYTILTWTYHAALANSYKIANSI